MLTSSRPEGRGFPNQALTSLRATADPVRGCGRDVCHVPGLWADTAGLVFLQANRLTAGCAKQPVLQETLICSGRYLFKMLIAPFTSALITAPHWLQIVIPLAEHMDLLDVTTIGRGPVYVFLSATRACDMRNVPIKKRFYYSYKSAHGPSSNPKAQLY